MGALILKSGNKLNDSVPPLSYALYKNRVKDDGGFIVNETKTIAALRWLEQNDIRPSQAYSVAGGAWGVKTDEDGYVQKLYSLLNPDGDLVAAGSVKKKHKLGMSKEHEVVRFKGSSTHYFTTAVPFTSAETLTIGVMHKPLILPDYDYSVHDQGLQFIFSPTLRDKNPNKEYVYLSKEVDTGLVGSVLQLLAHRSTRNLPPTQWPKTWISNGGVSDYTRGAGSAFPSNDVCFADIYWSSKHEPSQQYIRGESLVISKATPYILDLPDYQVNYGVSTSSGEGWIVGNPLNSDVMEFWTLRNATKEQAKAVSKRGSMYDGYPFIAM